LFDHRAAGDFVEAVQAPCRAAVNVAGIVRERNTNYILTLTELTGDMIQDPDPTPDTFYRNAQALADERVKQREAFEAVISETASAYLDFLYAPFYYLRGN